MHAVLSAWVTLIPEWQPAHEVAAAPGSWGVWQLVQIACAGTLAARSVSLAPWHPTQTFAPATNACGSWHPMHESWPAGFGPAGSLWHVLHSWSARAAGAWGLWQSAQPADPACAACSGARCVWQPAHASATIAGSPCGLWHWT